jgi:hypothetical protein
MPPEGSAADCGGVGRRLHIQRVEIQGIIGLRSEYQ